MSWNCWIFNKAYLRGKTGFFPFKLLRREKHCWRTLKTLFKCSSKLTSESLEIVYLFTRANRCRSTDNKRDVGKEENIILLLNVNFIFAIFKSFITRNQRESRLFIGPFGVIIKKRQQRAPGPLVKYQVWQFMRLFLYDLNSSYKLCYYYYDSCWRHKNKCKIKHILQEWSVMQNVSFFTDKHLSNIKLSLLFAWKCKQF